MRSLAAAVLALALLGAAPAPNAPSPPPADRVAQLMGTWSCRDGYGYSGRDVFRQDGDAVYLDGVVEYGGGHSRTTRQRFKRDPAGTWRIESAGGHGFSGEAPAWSSGAWLQDGALWYVAGGKRFRNGSRQIRYELVDAQTLRRTELIGAVATASELCVRGDTPPVAGTCVIRNLPATTISSVEPDTPAAAEKAGITGAVKIALSLDADSRVTNAVVQESASPLLEAASLAAARHSTYHTEIRDCHPVAATYVLTIEFGGG